MLTLFSFNLLHCASSRSAISSWINWVKLWQCSYTLNWGRVKSSIFPYWSSRCRTYKSIIKILILKSKTAFQPAFVRAFGWNCHPSFGTKEPFGLCAKKTLDKIKLENIWNLHKISICESYLTFKFLSISGLISFSFAAICSKSTVRVSSSSDLSWANSI